MQALVQFTIPSLGTSVLCFTVMGMHSRHLGDQNDLGLLHIVIHRKERLVLLPSGELLPRQKPIQFNHKPSQRVIILDLLTLRVE